MLQSGQSGIGPGPKIDRVFGGQVVSEDRHAAGLTAKPAKYSWDCCRSFGRGSDAIPIFGTPTDGGSDHEVMEMNQEQENERS